MRRSPVLIALVLFALLSFLVTSVGGTSAHTPVSAPPPLASPPPAPCDSPRDGLHSSATPLVEAAVARNPSDAGIVLGFCSTISGVTGAYSLNWSFGDGTTSTLRDPDHIYLEPANYTVTLTLNSSEYNTTSTIYALVNATVEATALYSPLAPTTATAINFTDMGRLGAPPYSVFWNFGDNMTATGPTVLHTYFTAGLYSVQVWTNDTGGGSAYELFQLNVTAAPVPPKQPTGSTDTLIGTSLAAVAVAVAGFVYLQWDKKRRPKLPTPAPPPHP